MCIFLLLARILNVLIVLLARMPVSTRVRRYCATSRMENGARILGGHTWPGGSQYAPEAVIRQDLNSNEAIWGFFETSVKLAQLSTTDR